MTVLAIALAGAAGAAARFVVDGAVAARARGQLPWGTLVVNVVGSLGAGMLAGAALPAVLPAGVSAVVSTGFLGAFTTFSTFAVETVRLVEEGRRGSALANVTANTLASAAAAILGLLLVGGL